MPATSDILSDIVPAESARVGKWWRRDEERFVGIPASQPAFAHAQFLA
jgi:hypothetical protein